MLFYVELNILQMYRFSFEVSNYVVMSVHGHSRIAIIFSGDVLNSCLFICFAFKFTNLRKMKEI